MPWRGWSGLTRRMTQPGAPIDIIGLPNLRDVGGWPTADGGRVRRGMAYRSTELGRLDADGVRAVGALGISTVYDFRTAAERAQQPDRVPNGVTAVNLDVLADSVEASAAASLNDIVSQPAVARKFLGDGKAVELMRQSYRDIVGLPSALGSYRDFFRGLSDAASRPALFHCTTGKDRTGWGAASLLMLLGVAEADVRRDYLLTNDELLPALKPVFDQFAAAGGEPDLLLPVLGVREEYLDTALDVMRCRFGGIEGYFADGLGIDATAQQALHAAFVEPVG